MRITNNKKSTAWFKYKVQGKTVNVRMKPFETLQINDLTDVNKVVSKHTILNFSRVSSPFTGLTGTNIVTNINFKEINLNAKKSFNQQTDGRFEIEF
jgi:hypothetical protein